MTAPTFAKIHNLIAFLAKPVESEGFKLIIDFLNGSSVRYALTASLTIHTSCIKQFWSTAKVKTVNDEVRVQALIDAKRCSALVLKPPPGMNLAALWHQQSFVFLQTRSLTSQGDMSHHQDIYDNPLLTKKVFTNIKRVGTGLFGVITPLFENMLVPAAEELGQAQDDISIPTKPSTFKPYKKHKSRKQQPKEPMVPSPESLPEHTIPSPSNDPIPDADKDIFFYIQIEKLEDKVHKLEEENRILKEKSFKSAKIDTATSIEDKEESFKQGMMIADMDEDVDVNLEEAQAKTYNLDLQHSEKVLSMQDINEEEPAKVEEVLEASAPRRRRGVVIQDPEEIASSVIVHTENDVIKQVKRSKRENNAVMRYQALKRKPLTKARARKNMMIYLKNMAGFKMNFFKGMTYSEIRPLFEKNYNSNQAFLKRVEEEVIVQEKEIKEEGNKRQGESLEHEIAKKQRMVKELKRHLQIMVNDDDVYTEATPLASKMFLLVEKKYPLTHFTLEQMLNNVTLEAEEESEMSLELLRLVRR
nr:hypothetical protein [Tanacetum cinerariifolium]